MEYVGHEVTKVFDNRQGCHYDQGFLTDDNGFD